MKRKTVLIIIRTSKNYREEAKIFLNFMDQGYNIVNATATGDSVIYVLQIEE